MVPALVGLVGPTASGKSALGLRLAEESGAEIISCDSLAVYRGLDIGSAKPTQADRDRVPHHLIDVADPASAFSAAEYARLARIALREIRERGHIALAVGGTGLYLRAFLGGLFEGPGRDEALRSRLDGLARRKGSGHLHEMLQRVDAVAAERINPHDELRIVRALEVYLLTGEAISERQQTAGEKPEERIPVRLFGLAPRRQELLRAVESRTREMFRRGLVTEVEALLAGGLEQGARALQAIGYKQALAVLGGRLDVAAAEQEVVRETMRLAKRQMTWFRHQAEVEWHQDAESAALAMRKALAEEDRGPTQ